jgi:hypothetical protein
MKKIFTLLFSTLIIGSSSLFAQSAVIFKPVAQHAIVVSFNLHRYNEMYSLTRYERDMRVKNINEDYNKALKNIVTMRFLSPAQKVKLIREIELKRAAQIKNVNERFNDSRNKYNDYYYDSNFRWRR